MYHSFFFSKNYFNYRTIEPRIIPTLGNSSVETLDPIMEKISTHVKMSVHHFYSKFLLFDHVIINVLFIINFTVAIV